MTDSFLRTWYVYTYAYPNGTMFYVGKGTNSRIFAHEQEAQSACGCIKCQTIRQIWESGNPVQKRIVFETFNEKEALIHEKQLIKQHAKTLVNIKHSRKICTERKQCLRPQRAPVIREAAKPPYPMPRRPFLGI